MLKLFLFGVVMSNEKEILLDLLRNVPVFEKFDSRDQADLAQLAVWKVYEKGDYIVHAGQVWPYVMVVATGEIRGIKMSSEGRLLETLKVKEGEGFWNPSFFDGLQMAGSVAVWEPTKIFLWHKDDIVPILMKNSEAMWQLSFEFVKHLRRKSELIEDFAFSTINRRLARLLLDQFKGVTDSSITRSLSLEEIGTVVGTTPIMICKHISRFSEAGYISVSRSEFELSNRAALEDIANAP